MPVQRVTNNSRGIFFHSICRDRHNPRTDEDPSKGLPTFLLRLLAGPDAPKPAAGRVVMVLVSAVVAVVCVVPAVGTLQLVGCTVGACQSDGRRGSGSCL